MKPTQCVVCRFTEEGGLNRAGSGGGSGGADNTNYRRDGSDETWGAGGWGWGLGGGRMKGDEGC